MCHRFPGLTYGIIKSTTYVERLNRCSHHKKGLIKIPSTEKDYICSHIPFLFWLILLKIMLGMGDIFINSFSIHCENYNRYIYIHI